MASLVFGREDPRKQSATSGAREAVSTGGRAYYEQLAHQLEINRVELEELNSLLRTERNKVYFLLFLIVGILIIGVVFLYFSFSGRIDELYYEYKTLLNIGGVFSVFGIIEIFSKFFATYDVISRVSRIIRRQNYAIHAAEDELNSAN